MLLSAKCFSHLHAAHLAAGCRLKLEQIEAGTKPVEAEDSADIVRQILDVPMPGRVTRAWNACCTRYEASKFPGKAMLGKVVNVITYVRTHCSLLLPGGVAHMLLLLLLLLCACAHALAYAHGAAADQPTVRAVSQAGAAQVHRRGPIPEGHARECRAL